MKKLKIFSGGVLILIGIIQCIFTLYSMDYSQHLYFRLNKSVNAYMMIIIGLVLIIKNKIKPTDYINYAGPFRRYFALLIDAMIYSIPTILLHQQLYKTNTLTFIIGNSLFSILYACINLTLLTKFGGSPGKLVMGIIVLKNDLSKIQFKDALKRSSIDMMFLLVSCIGLSYTYQNIDLSKLATLSFAERTIMTLNYYPLWFTYSLILQQYWIWTEIAVMLFNAQRKAIHDYIADTIVVMKKSTQNNLDNKLSDQIFEKNGDLNV